MTRKAGSNFAKWEVDQRIKHMLAGSCFYHLSNFKRYSQRSDYLTCIESYYDKERQVFRVGDQLDLYFGLQDVFAISGLPVDGLPLVCDDSDFASLCINMLGADEDTRKRNCGFLTRDWLKRNFEKVPQDTPDDELVKYVRAYLLHLIGGWVVTNSNGIAKLPIYLLKFLKDVTPRKLNSYAWGAAAHSQLHEMLSRGRKNLNGASWMLELFFFERIPEVAKSYLNLSSGLAQEIPQNREIPLFLSWTPLMLKASQNKRKDIDMSKIINEQMTEEKICWNPYVAYLNYEPQRIFHSRILLFCYDIINYHRPDRVPRQLSVCNPQPLEEMIHYQSKSSRGHTMRMFLQHYSAYIKIWEEQRYWETMCVRDNDVEFALPPEPTGDDFMESENLYVTNDDVNLGENDEVDHHLDNDAAAAPRNENPDFIESENVHDTNEALSRKRSEFALPLEPTSDDFIVSENLHVANDDVNPGENDEVDQDLDNDASAALRNENPDFVETENLHDTNEALSRKKSPVSTLVYTRKVKRVKGVEHQGGQLKMQNIGSGDHVKLQPHHEYLLKSLLPFLKDIHEEQEKEIVSEASARGVSPSSIKIEQVPMTLHDASFATTAQRQSLIFTESVQHANMNCVLHAVGKYGRTSL